MQLVSRLSRLGAVLGALAALSPALTQAAVSAAEAAKLRGELTAVGAEKAGNKDGTIPAWTGGFSPKSAPVTGRRTDLFPAEKPLFSITAQNMDKYADKLAPGTLAMLKKFPQTFRVDVYKTHRTVGHSPAFEDVTFKAATTTKMVVAPDGRSRVEDSTAGIPFPIPQNGTEAMFNHLMAYWPPYRTGGNNYLIQADGKRILVSVYSNDVMRVASKADREKDGGRYWKVRSLTTNPPIRAGEGIVAHHYEDSRKDSTWVYLPGQRRVRKLPTSCCDTPAPFAAGLISFDEIPGTFTGSLHKFDWTLVGKKEMYVPYNANKVFVPTKADDIFSKFHLNPDHVRWELHRVWVVEAKLKSGERHVSPRSTYYLDEDSWQALLSERYDAQGVLARTGVMLPLLLTETSTFIPGPWGYYDLISGASYIGSVGNEENEPIRVFDSFPSANFSPDALAGDGVR